MKGAGNMIGKNLLSSLCRAGIFLFFLGFFGGASLQALSTKESKEIKSLLKFMASHRVITLGLRFNELNVLVEKTKLIHPVELVCFILTDTESMNYFKKISKNFFKQQYLMREWQEIFNYSFRSVEFEEIQDAINSAGLDQDLIKDLIEMNNYQELFSLFFKKGAN
jgi:hypothetical protein